MAAASKHSSEMQLKESLRALADPKTDAEALHRHFMFIRDKDLDVALSQQDSTTAWAVRLARYAVRLLVTCSVVRIRIVCRKYYDRLNKAYVIVDLSRYTKRQVGMRWRTPREVSAGVGQFVCGAVGCNAARHLASLEVPFSYMEHGRTKHALVKACLCPVCTHKLLAASPRGSGGAPQAPDRKRVEAVLQAADATSLAPASRTQGSSEEHTRKRSRSGESHTQEAGSPSGGGAVPKASRMGSSATHRRNLRSPSAASAASGTSKGGASVGSAALKGLSDEALLRRLLR